MSTNRTTFTMAWNQQEGHHEWSWRTYAPNNEITAASGGETYGTVNSAVNGFLSSQGHTDWKPGDALPAGYTFEFNKEDNTYTMTYTQPKVEETQQESENNG